MPAGPKGRDSGWHGAPSPDLAVSWLPQEGCGVRMEGSTALGGGGHSRIPGSGVLNEGQHLLCTPPPPSVHVGHQNVVLFVCVRICTNVAGFILANKYKHKVHSLCPFVSAIPFRNKDLQCNSVLALQCHETSCCIEHSREFFLSVASHCGAQSCPRFTCKWKTGIAEPTSAGILSDSGCNFLSPQMAPLPGPHLHGVAGCFSPRWLPS